MSIVQALQKKKRYQTFCKRDLKECRVQILWKEIWKRPHYTKSFDVERYLKHCIVQHSLNRKLNSAKCRFLYKVNSGTNMKQFKLCWKIFERVHARSQVANYCIRAPFSSHEVCLEVLVEAILHSYHVMKTTYIVIIWCWLSSPCPGHYRTVW